MSKYILGWQWFRDFFNITIFKYFVTWFAIVPIFAKLTSLLPEKIQLELSSQNLYEIDLSLPFKWQILWISSIFFVIAYILYLFFCPKFITKYFSLKYYKDYEHSPRWLVWEAKALVKSNTDLNKFVERMSEKKYITSSKTNSSHVNYKKDPEIIVEKDVTTLYFYHANMKHKFSMPIITDNVENKDLTEIAVREIFWEIFGRFSSSIFFIRFIINLLLLLSLLTFSIPFFQSIVTGFKYVFGY